MNIILEAIWKHFKKHYGKLNNPVQKMSMYYTMLFV